MKRILCLMLALLCCLPILAACGGDEITLKLAEDGECTIIFDANLQTKDQMEKLASRIKKSLGIETVTIKSSTDFPVGVRASKGTILVGNLDIDVSKSAVEALRIDDFIVGVYGDYYILGGKSTNAVNNAVEYFRGEVLETLNSSMKVSSLNNHSNIGKYDVSTMTIGGMPIYKYQIVVPQSATITEKRFAADLQTIFMRKTGYMLEIVKKNAASAEGQIKIGSLCTKAKAEGPHTYAIAVNGTALELNAESYYAYSVLKTVVIDQVLASGVSDVVIADTFTKSGDAIAKAGDAYTHHGDIRIMFNNIWGSNEGAPSQRTEQLAEIYGEYLPDVLGLQEYAPNMRSTMQERLYALGYEEIPLGAGFVPHVSSETETRDPIFYRPDVVDLVDYGYECLALLPELDDLSGSGMAAALKLAKADKSKSVNWAIFKVRATGELFMAASVHLWWQGGTADDQIRVVQMRRMKEILSAEAAEYLQNANIEGTMPIFIGGDYNSNSNLPSLASMAQGTPFVNLNNMLPADKQLNFDTHHAYPTYNKDTGFWENGTGPSGSYSTAIDYIFASAAAANAGTFTLDHHAIVADDYAYFSSDHNAVWADISFTDKTPKVAVAG